MVPGSRSDQHVNQRQVARLSSSSLYSGDSPSAVDIKTSRPSSIKLEAFSLGHGQNDCRRSHPTYCFCLWRFSMTGRGVAARPPLLLCQVFRLRQRIANSARPEVTHYTTETWSRDSGYGGYQQQHLDMLNGG